MVRFLGILIFGAWLFPTSPAIAKTSTSQPTSKPTKTLHQTPIDCPLRKQGINPHGLKPFKDVAKYIRFLERPDRKLWQKPDQVVARLVSKLKLKSVAHVADVGAGSGYFTFRLAKMVPKGVVYAVDIEPVMLRHIHHKAMTQNVKNIRVILGSATDPKLPGPVDLLFMCDVLHHIKKPGPYLARMAAKLKKGGRLVLVEFKAGTLPKGPPAKLKLSRKRVLTMIGATGLKFAGEIKSLLPYQYLLIFEK